MILLSVSGGDSFFEFVVVLIVFVAILVITYYTTKWIAGYQKKNAILSDKEKLIVSYHEIGHALVAAMQTHRLRPISMFKSSGLVRISI